jgi:hypothetical protein
VLLGGGRNDSPPASQVDAGNSTDTSDATDPLENIEVGCALEINEPGRFAPDCQIVGSDDVIAQCDHVSEPGSAGMIQVIVHKPERIVVGTPAPLGGNDPVVSVNVASYSVRQGALVQTIDGTQEGASVSPVERVPDHNPWTGSARSSHAVRSPWRVRAPVACVAMCMDIGR